MPTLKFKDFPNIFKSITPLTIVRPKVTKAYFAEATIEEVEIESESGAEDNEKYTVESGDTLGAIATKKGTTVAAIIESDPVITTANQNSLSIGQEITLPSTVPAKEKKKKITFKKTDSGNLGKEIYVVVETELLQGKTMSINIRQGKEKGIEEQDENLMLKDDQDNYNTMVKTTIGGMCETDYLNKDDFADQAIFKISIDSSDEEKKDAWIKSLNDATDKKTLLYILTDAHTLEGQTELNIQYLGDTEEGEIRGEKITNRWLDTDGQWFELSEGDCCTMDITKEQLEKIATNATSANIDKYLDGFNETFELFDINTCLRRVHFLAQVTHESGSFFYNEEQGNESYIAAYNGWHGRGLIQLTTEGNYTAFGIAIGEDVTSTAANRDKLKDSPYATHSAGWYWRDQANLNSLADENDFIMITRKVNGGFNGYNDRLKYLKKGFKELIDKCSKDSEEDYDYEFSESDAYDDKRASFAWGLWHDPDLDKDGCTKSKEKALEGYERLIELTDENYSKTNWYKIKNIDEFSDIKYSVVKNGVTKYYVKVREAAESRIEALNSSNTED
ncbi:LysM peptidoglycan-binding domain-containing protein [uncultured Aquimarina sp.]|uniref:LysM peptidoglycan-binding domain-containing protein n=1 Tax=uncultured Aquimarina sp. TaxID=575652 RepID=UPI002615A77D|nr:LysM peptidoglycan-binding domain-containing protein [uncultured Aquimarina sp.]